MPLFDLPAPEPGERILDLGCGDGALTEKLASLGCDVVAVHASPAQVEGACARGLEARVADGEALAFEDEFDAVFSDAALHWMKRTDRVIAGAHRALRRNGRFVAECGGAGCVGVRPTPLPGNLVGWLETFAESFASALPAAERSDYLREVQANLEPKLRDTTGTWVADYTRLRFHATKGALR